MHTQDIATIDAQGGVQIRDRVKDIVKTGGEWVDSIQLEELVATAEGVAEASVIAVPDPKWGERPLAVLVAKADAIPTLEIINAPVRSEERRVGKACVSTCRSRWSLYNYKKKKKTTHI